MPSGVIEHVEALGLRTFGKEVEDPRIIVKRPVFTNKAVLQLYKTEIPSLFGRLLRDEGASLDREDPSLFNSELDKLLVEFGPQIWPQPGRGDRSHLRKPAKGTLYPSNLVYPRDQAILKKHLRNMILSKQARPDVDVDGLINKKGERHISRSSKPAPATPQNKPSGKGCSGKAPKLTSDRVRGTGSPSASHEYISSNSPTSVIGARTRGKQVQRDAPENSDRNPGYFQMELRLYRASSLASGHISPRGSLLLTDDYTSDECFSAISDEIQSDCSWIIFQLPEDMSENATIRVERGTRGSEAMFQRVLNIFRESPLYQGAPRACEVECGLDLM
ncbi:hypothetical protein CC78DRAFT_613653 [Lojkania enalia]|uniref:Uncharacterized protein n=1 Tax=Lojkania enalia TaxID=147567 RepID=A0A9P4N822_9PLEO|nr:hypothetical protein CC78DRAFT_613653 [Didymosphaeria enalia]